MAKRGVEWFKENICVDCDLKDDNCALDFPTRQRHCIEAEKLKFMHEFKLTFSEKFELNGMFGHKPGSYTAYGPKVCSIALRDLPSKVLDEIDKNLDDLHPEAEIVARYVGVDDEIHEIPFKLEEIGVKEEVLSEMGSCRCNVGNPCTK